MIPEMQSEMCQHGSTHETLQILTIKALLKIRKHKYLIKERINCQVKFIYPILNHTSNRNKTESS